MKRMFRKRDREDLTGKNKSRWAHRNNPQPEDPERGGPAREEAHKAADEAVAEEARDES